MSRAAVSPFVGRAAALGEVEAVLAAARNGTGTLLLVTGEPGVGKSRLAREAVACAAGYRTAWHRCAPAAAAFRPWTRLLGALAPGAAILPPTPVDREAVFDDVVDLLAVSAAETPLLLVLDDVHDADPSSLELLDHLAHQLVATRIVVLATSRDGAWSGREPQRGALSGPAAACRWGTCRSTTWPRCSTPPGRRWPRTRCAWWPTGPAATPCWSRSWPPSCGRGAASAIRSPRSPCPSRCERWSPPGARGCPRPAAGPSPPRRRWTVTATRTCSLRYSRCRAPRWSVCWTRPGTRGWSSRAARRCGTTCCATPSCHTFRQPSSSTCMPAPRPRSAPAEPTPR